MNNGNTRERLSWGDALFLYLERAGMPLNIASVTVFEGDISLDECIRTIESKLPRLPRYYQRAVAPPFNIGFPSWEDDPKFDIRNHIKEVHLKRGTEAELKRLAGRVLSTVMDRAHPLWDITLVHGLHRGHTAMIIRAHHCLADGIAGLGLMNVLLDATPAPVQPVSARRPHRPRKERDSLSLLLEGWISSYSDLLDRVLLAQSDLVNITENFVGGQWPSQEFARFLPELTAPTERLFFNMTYQGPQKFVWVQIPTSAIKSIRRSCGGTHNDVVLTLITSTLGRYAELHGDKIKGRSLRMMVPINVRGANDTSELGNRISLLPVTVPLGIRSPRKLLKAVHERMDFLKRVRVAEWVSLAGGFLGAVPAPLQALVGPVASLLPVTPFNLVCTNLRGPDTPLFLCGKKMLRWYPYVPVGGEMALNCAVLSYCGVTYFGFSGDVHAAPDLHRLETLLKLSLADLLKTSEIGPVQRKKIRPRLRSSEKVTTPAAKVAPPAPVNGTQLTSQPPPGKEAVPFAMAAD